MSDTGKLDQKARARLLEVARQTIAHYLETGTVDSQDPGLPGLGEKLGAFVTLHKDGGLRGCIGNFTSDKPLVNTIEDMAVAAATTDPRFPSLAPGELDQCDLEISVLSPLKPISDLNEIKVGVHGIYIISPQGRGVLLPQVATEYGWDRQTFLEHTCTKAGLYSDCWQNDDVQILIFSAQVFGEKDLLEG